MTFGTGVMFGLICGVFLMGGMIVLVAVVEALIRKIKECIDG